MKPETLSCHFCKKRDANEDTAFIKEMIGPAYPDPNSRYMKILDTHISAQSERYGIRTTTYNTKYIYVSWKNEKVKIPRCSYCYKKQNIIRLFAFNGWWIGFILFFVGGFTLEGKDVNMNDLFLKQDSIISFLIMVLCCFFILSSFVCALIIFYMQTLKVGKFPRMLELKSSGYRPFTESTGDKPENVHADPNRYGSEYPRLSRFRDD
ncbi:MAG TPA: hypothetical protein VIK55_03880 [Paludibacter sp.]